MTFTYNGDSELQTAGTSGPGTGQPNVLLSYTYDQSGSKTSITDNLSSAGSRPTRTMPMSSMTQVATSYGGTAGPQVAFGYDSGGRLTSADRTIGGSGDSVNTSYGYDAANRQTTITDSVHIPSGSGGGTTTPIATYVYSYDNANRVTTQVNADGTYTYTYDNANELTNVDKNGTQVESYSYDLNGNRTATGYTTTVMNETATSPGVTYSYDNAGNMISANNGTTITTYTYDFRNRLTEVTQGGTVIATYTYDALNRRIGVDDNGTETWTVYDGTNPYADFNGSGTLQERYQYGPGVVDGAIVDQLLARTSSGGTTAWYLPDKLGSVRDIVSTTGTELDHIAYDSFGNIVTETNASNGDRFKYAGMEYDSTTEQDYDRARYYSAGIGRFSSIDPTGFSSQDVNIYRYVLNSSPNFTDPTGLQATGEGGNEKREQIKAAQVALMAADNSVKEAELIKAAFKENLDATIAIADSLRKDHQEFVDTVSKFQAAMERQALVLSINAAALAAQKSVDIDSLWKANNVLIKEAIAQATKDAESASGRMKAQNTYVDDAQTQYATQIATYVAAVKKQTQAKNRLLALQGVESASAAARSESSRSRGSRSASAAARSESSRSQGRKERLRHQAADRERRLPVCEASCLRLTVQRRPCISSRVSGNRRGR